jgi:hypothetical protein
MPRPKIRDISCSTISTENKGARCDRRNQNDESTP